jgi:hypothetical protein
VGADNLVAHSDTQRRVSSSRSKAFFGLAWVKVTTVLSLSLLVASVADHLFAAWLRLEEPLATFRRIGPEEGPQVFCAGSSLLQFGLAWSEVSRSLGRGIENWPVPASSPDIWETSQRFATNTDLMLIGVSVYDLNEHHVSERRAKVVPVVQTIRDLRDSGADWELSRRLLNQYAQATVRTLFPTAGLTDKVHAGLRAKARAVLGLSSAAGDEENALVLPTEPVLEFGESTKRVSDWDNARMLRRVALLRSENGGEHAFDGPKRLAFNRMLGRARERGGIIIVVLPVSDGYADAFHTPDVRERFEAAVAQARQVAPDALVIRLDRVPGLTSNEYFSDLVHLNSAGRRIATDSFLSQLKGFPAHQPRGHASALVAGSKE